MAEDASYELPSGCCANGVAMLESSGGIEYTRQLEEQVKKLTLNDDENSPAGGRFKPVKINGFHASVLSQLADAEKRYKHLEWRMKQQNNRDKKIIEEKLRQQEVENEKLRENLEKKEAENEDLKQTVRELSEKPWLETEEPRSEVSRELFGRRQSVDEEHESSGFEII